MSGPPVVLTTNARPVTNVISGAVPMVVVNTLGEPVTLVNSGGEPVTLLNADGTAYGDLARLIALSPSLLIWPAQGAGWQGTSGGTLAASGQPLGLGADLSQLGGKTLTEWLATAPNIWTDAAFTNIGTTGTGTATISSGVITVTSVDTSNFGIARLNLPSSANKTYSISYTVTRISGAAEQYNSWNIGMTGGSAANLLPGSISLVVNAVGATAFVAIQTAGNTAGVFTVSNIRIIELPGNHLRAGTWASPSDSARGMFQNNAINFDGVNDYYSLLNAISITTNMTVVRAFKRASAGIGSIGLAKSGAFFPLEMDWAADNTVYTGLGGNWGGNPASANTTTGSFVSSVRRNASAESVRLKGVQTGSIAARTVSGVLDILGFHSGVGYNSGEISFLAVFPTELTGANLALVEQIAASTNGATLS